MPAKSEKQQRAMGMAYAAKTGKLDPKKLSPKLRKMMGNMSEKQLKEFAETKHSDIKKEACYSFIARSLIKRASSKDDNSSNLLANLKDMLPAAFAQLGTPLYVGATVKPMLNAKLTNDETRLLNALKEKLKKENIRIYNPIQPLFSELTPFASVGPEGEKVISSPSYKNPFILAHEYGHTQGDILNYRAEFLKANPKLDLSKVKLKELLSAKDTKKLIGDLAYRLGSPAVLGSTGALLISDNENVALPTALIGTGATIPMLSEEIKASHTGAKAIKDLAKQNKIPLKVLDKLKPYVGVPTYAAVASVPLLTYMFKKLRGRYDKE